MSYSGSGQCACGQFAGFPKPNPPKAWREAGVEEARPKLKGAAAVVGLSAGLGEGEDLLAGKVLATLDPQENTKLMSPSFVTSTSFFA